MNFSKINSPQPQAVSKDLRFNHFLIKFWTLLSIDCLASILFLCKSPTLISPQVEDQQQQFSGGRATHENFPHNQSNLVQSQLNALPPVQVNDFLPSISRWTSLGGLFIVGAVGITFALASVIQYKVTIQAQAIVRPAGELRIVQAATEGSVLSISAKENQLVKKGDIIATIDDSQLQTKKSQLHSSIGQAQLQRLQINAQIRAINSQIQAETDRIQRAVASATTELSRRQREYRDKKITTYAEVQEAQANFKQAQEELQKAQAQLKSTEANLKSAKVSLKAASSKRDRYQTVAEAGALSTEQLEEAELAVEQQKQTVAAQQAAFEAQQQTIEQHKQGVEAARARWQRTKAGLNPSQAEVDIASEGIAQEKASGEATLATLDKEREALIQQRIQISKQLERDSRELQQVEIDLNKTTITATADGIISRLNLRNSGQTVRSGEKIAQIVPSNAPLHIKAAVSPKDIGKLAEDQKVQMRVSACPYPDYGTLKGTVSQVSQDTIKTQEDGTSTQTFGSSNRKGDAVTGFYEVTISPESLSLGSGKNQCAVQLGMEGRADIISREETVLQFFLRKARLITDI